MENLSVFVRFLELLSPSLSELLEQILISLLSTWSSLWHGEERHRDCCNVSDAARAHHEVHHPSGHGGYHRHLWASGGSADSQQHL